MMYTDNYTIEPNIIKTLYEKNSHSVLSECRADGDNIQLGFQGNEGGFTEEMVFEWALEKGRNEGGHYSK